MSLLWLGPGRLLAPWDIFYLVLKLTEYILFFAESAKLDLRSTFFGASSCPAYLSTLCHAFAFSLL